VAPAYRDQTWWKTSAPVQTSKFWWIGCSGGPATAFFPGHTVPEAAVNANKVRRNTQYESERGTKVLAQQNVR
jgi:hypothetical protein